MILGRRRKSPSRPASEWSEIISIVDHIPVDGPISKRSVVNFADHTWEFIWNVEFKYKGEYKEFGDEDLCL